MNSRTTLFAVFAATGLTVLGLAALGAASLRIQTYVPGFIFIAFGGVVAAATRLKREPKSVESEAIEQLMRARAELSGENPALAARAANRAAILATSSQTRNRALTTLAWAALAQGYPERAKAALDQTEPAYAVDVHCFAAVEAARGRTQLAFQALETLRTARALNREAAKLLVECCLRVFGIEQAVSMAFKTRAILGRENCEIVVKAAHTAGAHGAADSLANAIGKRSDGGETPTTARVLPTQA